jgi:Xaa-Pro aminopeptidase
VEARHRRQALRSLLGEAGLDALLVSSLVNVRYLSGFTGSAGQLLVAADPGGDLPGDLPGDPGDLIVTDGRYGQQVAAQAPDLTAVITRADDWFYRAIGGMTRVGLEAEHVSWSRARTLRKLAESVELVPVSGLVERLRAVKDEQEIALIARACSLADEAFADLLTWIAPGMTERAVGRRLDRTVVDLGADDRSFETIVASGPNSAVPHHRPTDRVLRVGDVVKLDFGGLVGGYHSDMTRMVALGAPDRRLADVFDLVRAAQQAGLDAVAAGVGTVDVDAACRRVIADAGHGDHFVHGTGHGVGLQIHEDPRLVPATEGDAPGAAARLASRMAVTVEPGVYLPGIGGVRIEDTVVVGPRDGTRVAILTTTPKDLPVL